MQKTETTANLAGIAAFGVCAFVLVRFVATLCLDQYGDAYTPTHEFIYQMLGRSWFGWPVISLIVGIAVSHWLKKRWGLPYSSILPDAWRKDTSDR